MNSGTPTPRPTQLLSITEAAARLSCSRGHVYNLLNTGKLAGLDIGALGGRAKTRIRESDLEAYLTKQLQAAS